MKAKPPEKIQKATNPSTRGHWNEMNRKQRRELMRKIQSEDISLEVIHPDAAGIDIGNESHYVAVPRPWRSHKNPNPLVGANWVKQSVFSLRKISSRIGDSLARHWRASAAYKS